VLLNYYKDEELADVKDILHNDVTRTAQSIGHDADLPRLPKRQGLNKCKQNAEDLLTLYNITDKWKLNGACDEANKSP